MMPGACLSLPLISFPPSCHPISVNNVHTHTPENAQFQVRHQKRFLKKYPFHTYFEAHAVTHTQV